MPEPPGFLNKFAFIVSFIFNKCHHPWTLYVKWSVPPTVEASRSLLALDVPQIFRSALRPRGRRTARHGGKEQKKRGKGQGGIPDIWEITGKGISEAIDQDARVVTKGVEQLWTILDHGEKWLGRLFIVDVVEEWLYKEALLVSANDGVECNRNAVRAEGGGGVVTDGFGIHFITGSSLVWATGTATAAAGVLYLNCERGMATMTCSVRNDGDGTGRKAPMTVILGVIGPDGHFLHGFSDTVDLDYGDVKDMMCTVFFKKGDSSSVAWGLFSPNTGGGSHAAILDVVQFGQQY